MQCVHNFPRKRHANDVMSLAMALAFFLNRQIDIDVTIAVKIKIILYRVFKEINDEDRQICNRMVNIKLKLNGKINIHKN